MKCLYISLIDKLTSVEANDLFISRQLPAIKFVDLYTGQEQEPEDFELIPLPAILFSWSIEKDSNINEGKAIATITLNLLYEQARETNSLAKARDKALKVFDFIDTVDELVEGLESDNTGRLTYESEHVIQLAPIINMISINYTCSYFGKVPDRTTKFDYSDPELSMEMTGGLTQTNTTGLFDS